MSMYGSGLLVLTYRPQSAFLLKLLNQAARCVNRVLYVDLWQESSQDPSGNPQSNGNFGTTDSTKSKAIAESSANVRIYYDLMREIYQKASLFTKHVDVRVLLPSAGGLSRRKFSLPLEVCIGNAPSIGNLMEFEHLVSQKYDFHKARLAVKYINLVDTDRTDQNRDPTGLPVKKQKCEDLRQYPGVVIGGTFDQIHDGHRLLMGIAALLGTEKFTAGISEGPLLKDKVLKELVEPLNTRISYVDSFIQDVRPGLARKIVGLKDPAGPSGTDDDLQLLVVSEETARGIDVVNEIRKKNKLLPLDVHTIDMVLDEDSDKMTPLSLSAEKTSSTQRRINMLGCLRKTPKAPRKANYPYVIGVSGGIASGKSSIAKRIQKFGAGVINCDKLGHQAYNPGKPAYEKLVDEFGHKILNDDDTINRRKLGSIVFSNRSKLNRLNEIVWPEIARMVDEKLSIMWHDGIQVCIVEAAVLLEAGWDSLVNEVWITIVPREEAIKRIVERDNLSVEQAEIRIDAQMSNQDRVDKAHVVLSTLWEPEFTQKQVEKAWEGLKERTSIQFKKPSL